MSALVFEQRRTELRRQLAAAAAKGWRYVLAVATERGASAADLAYLREQLAKAEAEAK